MSSLAVVLNLLGDATRALLGQGREGLGCEVEVLDTLVGVRGVVPSGLEEVDELLRDTESSSRVSRQVDSGETRLSSELGGLEEVVVLSGSERTDLEGDVVGDDDDLSALRVLGSDWRRRGRTEVRR